MEMKQSFMQESFKKSSIFFLQVP